MPEEEWTTYALRYFDNTPTRIKGLKALVALMELRQNHNGRTPRFLAWSIAISMICAAVVSSATRSSEAALGLDAPLTSASSLRVEIRLAASKKGGAERDEREQSDLALINRAIGLGLGVAQAQIILLEQAHQGVRLVHRRPLKIIDVCVGREREVLSKPRR